MPRREPGTDAKPLDPVAVSLALWLGLMVGALGLQRLAEQVTLDAARTAATTPRDTPSGLPSPTQAYQAWGS